MDLTDLSGLNKSIQLEATTALESGKVVYFPSLAFFLRADEQELLHENILASGYKNISFDIKKQQIAGVNSSHLQAKTHGLMERYAHFSRGLIDQLFPAYQDAIRWGRTSYRPAEIDGRATSKRKDDTRLHVDAFPATPVQGLRILRVFCNINPVAEPRVWHLGEPFSEVIDAFCARIPRYSYVKAKFLKMIKTTKSLRTAYDHYMLHLHDTMKLDENYQQTVQKTEIAFPAKSTWIVFTDHVSHAALKGQFLLEQTFYLPVEAMVDPMLSPLKQWERKLASCKIKQFC
jgi:hypothetical protein